jgi:hypothetical protein
MDEWKDLQEDVRENLPEMLKGEIPTEGAKYLPMISQEIDHLKSVRKDFLKKYFAEKKEN